MGIVGSGQGEAYWVMGARYTFKVNGVDSGGAYMMFEAEVPPAPGPPPHLHTREDEMFYVLEGEPHVKYQPVHRLATYERYTEWFQFWLMRQINCDTAKAGQYARWMAMKDAPKAVELRCENAASILP